MKKEELLFPELAPEPKLTARDKERDEEIARQEAPKRPASKYLSRKELLKRIRELKESLERKKEKNERS